MVESMSRCEALVRRFPGALVVEIAPHLVLTLDGEHPAASESRSAAPVLVAQAVIRRAGRMAVTYREVRSGHDITWTVVVDGGVRIGIGCQAAPGRRADIDAVCDEAVRTARAIA